MSVRRRFRGSLHDPPSGFVADSPLEGDGFELSVPRKRHNKFDVTRPHAGTESSYPTPKSWFPKVIPLVTTEDCAESLVTRGGAFFINSRRPRSSRNGRLSVPESIASL